MITITEYSHKKIGVFGLGKSGEAAVASLNAGGAEVFAADDTSGGDYTAWPWAELAALVLSPGVPLTHPKPHPVVELARRHNVPIIGDIELLYRACPEAHYIAITGTNGKSTTTTLIGHILKEAGLNVEIGGNLGTPALALQPLGKEGIYVLELSSYQLDLVKTTRFNVAILLNITPDHLDRHGDMAGYIQAKMHIFERQQANDVAVLAIDDEFTSMIADRLFGRYVVKVSAQQPADVYAQDGRLFDTAIDASFDLRGIASLTGRHNWQNAGVAYVAARTCGIPAEMIYQAMQSFPGLRHRLQLVATIHGVRFINDSKATNADATANALAPYDPIYWILGGKPKAGGIESLQIFFPKIAHAFLIGEAEEEFARTLEGKVPYTRCGTLEKAVEMAARMAFQDSGFRIQDSGGKASSSLNPESRILAPVVLLSPACASFDQFKSFEHRGDVFCELVENLKNTGNWELATGNCGASHAS